MWNIYCQTWEQAIPNWKWGCEKDSECQAARAWFLKPPPLKLAVEVLNCPSVPAGWDRWMRWSKLFLFVLKPDLNMYCRNRPDDDHCYDEAHWMAVMTKV